MSFRLVCFRDIREEFLEPFARLSDVVIVDGRGNLVAVPFIFRTPIPSEGEETWRREFGRGIPVPAEHQTAADRVVYLRDGDLRETQVLSRKFFTYDGKTL